jgi:glycosyltransferase involved in cell wall biosynthesis
VVESMACGTPVIAYTRGSMPEIVEDGRTGFLVTDVAQAVDAVSAAAALDRAVIRAAVVARFDVAAMVDRYVGVYRAITGSRRTGAVD